MTTTAVVAVKARIRAARTSDLPRLSTILNTEILSSTATWTTSTRTNDQMSAWLASREADGFPVLVAECPDSGAVAGYASYGPFRNGEGYSGTVEHSVYVDGAFRGRGIAACLIGALIARATDSGLRLMIGGISSEATASLRLHRKLGFRQVGRIPGAGHKFGRSLDLVLMARSLVPGSGAGRFH